MDIQQLKAELGAAILSSAQAAFRDAGLREKHIDKYLAVLVQFLAGSLVKYGETVTGEIQIAWNDMNRKAGRIKVNGKDEYVANMLLHCDAASPVRRVYEGNIGKNSRVTLHPNYRDKLMAVILYTARDLEQFQNPAFVASIDKNSNTTVPVNMKSLTSFISKTFATYQEAIHSPDANARYKQTLEYNMTLAMALRDLVKQDADGMYLMEQWESIDSGRMYARGISLQTCPSQVRHAALGHCHKYDLQAASYALLAGLALHYDRTLKLGAVRDYIDNRSTLRKRLAENLGISEELMKQVFTSLGFGAEMVDNPHKTIRGLLGPARFAALGGMKEFRHINEDMERIRDVILANFDTSKPFHGRTYTEIDSKTGKTRTKDQKLAWVYQAMETAAMLRFSELASRPRANKPAGYQPLLWVHDCLYFAEKLPLGLFEDIQWELKKEFPLLHVDHESIWPIQLDSDYEAARKATEAMEAEHRQAIAAEEARSGTASSTEEVLDPLAGHFAEEIKALNERPITELGTTVSPR